MGLARLLSQGPAKTKVTLQVQARSATQVKTQAEKLSKGPPDSSVKTDSQVKGNSQVKPNSQINDKS